MSITSNLATSFLRTLNQTALRVDPLLSSSAQSSCLSPVRAPSSEKILGLCAGVSLTTGKPWYWSLHGAYAGQVIHAPNAVIIGAYNSSKSSLAKCVYVLRTIALGGRAVVFDRKNQVDGTDTTGEYIRVAETTNGAVFSFDRRPGKGCTINLLDPALSALGDEDSTVGQDELLLMAAEIACGYELVDDSTSAPAYALRAAHNQALTTARTQGRDPNLRDVVNALYDPWESSVPGQNVVTDFTVADQATVATWGLPVALGLERFLTGDLSGLIGDKTVDEQGMPLDLGNPLIVFDTSALAEGSTALGFIVATTMAYVSAVWSKQPGAKILINEEAYFTSRLPRVPAVMRAIAKRGRAFGVGVVTLIHHLSDIPRDSDLWALVQETDVAHLFRQDKTEDIQALLTMFDLPPHLSETISSLPNGQHLLRVTNQPVERILHIRSQLEVWLTSTDAGMIDSLEGLSS